MALTFEFDVRKSRANVAKHGIDFVQAQDLWRDEQLLEIPARTVDEPRSLIVAMLEGQHWSAIVTYRGERIRLISVRRSREQEARLYEGS